MSYKFLSPVISTHWVTKYLTHLSTYGELTLRQTKCIFFLFLWFKEPICVVTIANTENQPHHQIKTSTAVEVFLTLAANQIAHSPPTQQLQTLFSADLLWCWGNLVYHRSDRWLSCRLNRFKISAMWTALLQPQCFHRLFLHMGLNTQRHNTPSTAALLFHLQKEKEKSVKSLSIVEKRKTDSEIKLIFNYWVKWGGGSGTRRAVNLINLPLSAESCCAYLHRSLTIVVTLLHLAESPFLS